MKRRSPALTTKGCFSISAQLKSIVVETALQSRRCGSNPDTERLECDFESAADLNREVFSANGLREAIYNGKGEINHIAMKSGLGASMVSQLAAERLRVRR